MQLVFRVLGFTAVHRRRAHGRVDNVTFSILPMVPHGGTHRFLW